MYDVFVAQLHCQACDTAVEAEIQTHIRGASADGSALRVGSPINPYYLQEENSLDAGYALIKPAEPGRPIRLLDTWSCPNCHTEQWAVVEIAEDRVRRIESLALDRETLDGANYISEIDAELLASALAGEDLRGEQSIEMLRCRL